MNKKEIQKGVENALEEIRPFLLSDGGDISLVSITQNVVTVELLGACTHCNINKMTLKNGVEETIKRYVPQIIKVINVNG